MSGQLLRKKDARHQCGPPERAQRGAVWCCDCGRRWTCVDDVTQRPGRITMQADWRRRYWPWPKEPLSPKGQSPAEEVLPAVPAGLAIKPGDLSFPLGGGVIDHRPKLSPELRDPPQDQAWLGFELEGRTAPHHCPGCRCGE